MADLAAEYLAGNPAVLARYEAAPRAVFEIAKQGRPLSPKLVTALHEYQAHLGLSRDFDGSEAVVITGQQPGLLTGPLYTLYKAITTIQLARALEGRTGRRHLPVFWIGADDHDFEELSVAHLLTRQGELRELRYVPEPHAERLPMFRVPLTSSLHELIEETAGAAPGSEFGPEIEAFLHESLDSSAHFSEWFARITARLFRDTPLVFFSPELPAARALAADVFAREIETPLATTQAVNRAGEELTREGFGAQVTKGQDECSFFLFENGRRCKVLFDGEYFVLPEVGQRLSRDALLARLRSAPEDFSGNVVLRCILQQHLFDPAAYVAGPGEVSYWAQFKPVFERYKMTMPVVYPRAKVVLSSLKLSKLLEKTGLILEDLLLGPEAALHLALERAPHSAVSQVLVAHEREFLATAQRLQQELENAKGSRPLLDMAQAFNGQLAQHLDRLKSAALRDNTQQVRTLQQQVERLCHSLAPSRKPQERVLSVFSFLFAQGWELVPRLIHSISMETFEMQQVEL